MTAKTGIGQDSHAFEEAPGKPLILAGIRLDHPIGLKGNSDADVVLHSITNAISSITGNNILGSVADQLSKEGVTFPASPQRSPDGSVEVIYATGPEGLLLELVEELY